jgi:hypothetical protein
MVIHERATNSRTISRIDEIRAASFDFIEFNLLSAPLKASPTCMPVK